MKTNDSKSNGSQKANPATEEFVFEEPDDYDWVKERFEIMGIKMDIHKNGVLFLKELELLLHQLDVRCRGSVSNFLIAYMKQTKKLTIQLPVFVSNIYKAYQMDKFGLREMIEGVKTKGEDLNVEEIVPVETAQRPKNLTTTLKTDRRPAKVPSKKAVKPPVKEMQTQAAYSRHTKSSLAHQRKIQAKKAPEVPPIKPQTASKPRPKLEQRKTEPAIEVLISGNSQQLSQGNSTVVFHTVTDDLLKRNDIENIAQRFKIPERVITTDERELKRCTFKPNFSKPPTRYQNIKSRLLEHFEASDSISEEAEFAYELKHELKKRRMIEWQNRSCDGVMNSLVPGRTSDDPMMLANRPLSPVISKDSIQSSDEKGAKVGRSSSVDKLCFEITPNKPQMRTQLANANNSRYNPDDSSNSLADAVCTPRSTDNSGYYANMSMKSRGDEISHPRSGNMSGLYKSGYSYKHKGKKLHNKVQTPRSYNTGYASREKSGTNSWELYNLLHGENSGRLIDPAKGSSGLVQGGPGEIHKTMKRGVRLQNILGSEQLDKMKKMHQLYATQRSHGK